MDLSTPLHLSPTASTPIDSLPVEVLEKILLLAVRSSPDTREFLRILSLVCKAWASLLELQVFRSHFSSDFKDSVCSYAGNRKGHLRGLWPHVERFFPNGQPDDTLPFSLVLKTGYNEGVANWHYGNGNSFRLHSTLGGDGLLDEDTARLICEADICVDPVVALSFFFTFHEFCGTFRNACGRQYHAVWERLTTLKLVSTWGARMPTDHMNFVVNHADIATQMPLLTDFQLTAHDITPWMTCIPWSQLKVLRLRIQKADIEDIFEVFDSCEENLEDVYLQAKAYQRDIDERSFSTSRSVFQVLKRFELVLDMDDACQVSFCSILP